MIKTTLHCDVIGCSAVVESDHGLPEGWSTVTTYRPATIEEVPGMEMAQAFPGDHPLAKRFQTAVEAQMYKMPPRPVQGHVCDRHVLPAMQTHEDDYRGMVPYIPPV